MRNILFVGTIIGVFALRIAINYLIIRFLLVFLFGLPVKAIDAQLIVTVIIYAIINSVTDFRKDWRRAKDIAAAIEFMSPGITDRDNEILNKRLADLGIANDGVSNRLKLIVSYPKNHIKTIATVTRTYIDYGKPEQQHLFTSVVKGTWDKERNMPRIEHYVVVKESNDSIPKRENGSSNYDCN